MPIFNTKEEFFAHGVELVEPSTYHTSADCEICLDPLDLVQNSSSSRGTNPRLHRAIRIKSCRHVHGLDCLTAFLNIGNSCPTCKTMLFLPASEQPLTQQDVDELLRNLRDTHDEDSIMCALARYMRDVDEDASKRKQLMDSLVALAQVKEEEKEKENRDEMMLREEDFLDSDEEMSWDDSIDEEYLNALGEQNSDDMEDSDEEDLDAMSEHDE